MMHIVTITTQHLTSKVLNSSTEIIEDLSKIWDMAVQPGSILTLSSLFKTQLSGNTDSKGLNTSKMYISIKTKNNKKCLLYLHLPIAHNRELIPKSKEDRKVAGVNKMKTLSPLGKVSKKK